jgi:asparagine synthase (glutamine-hydrolysing)
MDEPSAGPSVITQFAVMKTASKHVKIILDGQGADELFCGYISFIPAYISELLRSRNILNALRAVRLAFNLLIHWGGQYAPLALNIIRRYGWGFFKSRYLRKDAANAVLPVSDFTDSFNERTGDVSFPAIPKIFKSPANNLCLVQTTILSIPSLLHYEDRNCAAFSIEARTPILDFRVAEYALGLPPEYKVRGACWTKWPLRKMIDKMGLKKIAWRRSKMGYPTPLVRWLRQGGDAEALKEIIDRFKLREIVKPEIIDSYYQGHISGKADHSVVLYRYLTLEIWYQIFIDDFMPHYARKGADA